MKTLAQKMKEQGQFLASRAASEERRGNYKTAQAFWLKSTEYPCSETNMRFRNIRAEICQRRDMEASA
ncbi:ANR family transcriptional regulator [Salmonella enterica]|nr:ANR family transcriptional regulator [Salmonella enterica]EBG5293728.1 ANR family transcriptional regulator [Salmonella enterica subsp. enterica]EEJ7233404.1 ANR family transcriptional regulator [Salmonella enterica subsp. salamae]HCM1854111.1 ANR family transcriptional regulator [Salmonella enterica subsp. arizonae serovar 56:z4,z23:-]EBB1398622.1 ANR family transcriptional regulator [Salmonella enterica]